MKVPQAVHVRVHVDISVEYRKRWRIAHKPTAYAAPSWRHPASVYWSIRKFAVFIYWQTPKEMNFFATLPRKILTASKKKKKFEKKEINRSNI